LLGLDKMILIAGKIKGELRLGDIQVPRFHLVHGRPFFAENLAYLSGSHGRILRGNLRPSLFLMVVKRRKARK
jgi:hypothetical protein